MSNLLYAFAAGISDRRCGFAMTAHPHCPDEPEHNGAYWCGYLLADHFDFQGLALIGNGVTFDQVREQADALGIDWVTHVIKGGRDGLAESARLGEITEQAHVDDYAIIVSRLRYEDSRGYPAQRMALIDAETDAMS